MYRYQACEMLNDKEEYRIKKIKHAQLLYKKRGKEAVLDIALRT